MGYILAVASGLCGSARDVLSKGVLSKLSATDATFATFLFALPFYVLILGVLIPLGVEHPQFGEYYFTLLILRSITDCAAEWLKMKALSLAEMSLVMPVIALSPVAMLFLSPLITKDIPTSWGICGVLICIVGTFVLLFSEKRQSTTAKEPSKQTRAILLAAGSTVAFATNSCLDRLAVQQGTPVWSAFLLTLFTACMFLPRYLGKAKTSAIMQNTKVLSYRGFFEVSFMSFKLSALQLLQAPYVAALHRISLPCSVIAGKFFYKEENFRRRFIASLLILSGSLLVIVAG